MILEKSDKTRVHHLEDALHVHILLFYADNQPILAGPYLSERMDASLCSRIGRKFSLSSDQQYDLLIGYGSLPVLSSSQANAVFQSVLEAADLDFLQYNSSLPDSDIQQDTEVTYHLNEISNKNLELHYATERIFMNAIRAGDFPKAMKYQMEMASHASGLYLNNFKKNLPASKGGELHPCGQWPELPPMMRAYLPACYSQDYVYGVPGDRAGFFRESGALHNGKYDPVPLQGCLPEQEEQLLCSCPEHPLPFHTVLRLIHIHCRTRH